MTSNSILNINLIQNETLNMPYVQVAVQKQ